MRPHLLSFSLHSFQCALQLQLRDMINLTFVFASIKKYKLNRLHILSSYYKCKHELIGNWQL